MSGWEMVIGLETHVELSTRTKIFCSCLSGFGAEPNTNVCPVCMGLPGALPCLNKSAVLLAAKAGLALSCHVHRVSRFDRKNYFYPDLPKAYQISQFYRPLCEGGAVEIQTGQGAKSIGITRIHMEEDAGKLLHAHGSTLIDMNRCGVPLIEIVTEPDIRSAEEAVLYLRKLRAILVYAGVSDCRMNEGSLRCDVNLSVRRPGQPLGTRTEMKNLNSFQSVERAIEAEFARQTREMEAGGTVQQQTRRFDQRTGKTYPMRRKESSADYRYFPDPDIPEVALTREELDALKASLPALPDERKRNYVERYDLTLYAAEQLTAEKWLADYFEKAVSEAKSPQALSGLLIGETLRLLSGREEIPVAHKHMARLADMTAGGEVNSSTAKRILAALFERDMPPEEYARENELTQMTDERELRLAAESAISENPDMVKKYLSGKVGVKKALMGKAMAVTKGRADPGELSRLMDELLTRMMN